MIVFTRREMERAWRENHNSYLSAENKNNTHRLMLFYAVECGLKSIVMRRNSKEVTDSDITNFSHDIKKIIDCLNINVYRLGLSTPIFVNQNTIDLSFLKERGELQSRRCHISEINQVWRYGHCFSPDNQLKDEDIEKDLLCLVNWIKQELRD